VLCDALIPLPVCISSITSISRRVSSSIDWLSVATDINCSDIPFMTLLTTFGLSTAPPAITSQMASTSSSCKFSLEM
jgi:hypothetical protein